ncbi:hypothetical protein [Micromonospora haikouensis]|uniref:hypothetical protein n=1 Tax=Micromonospora haikouensis TaxID=686309 RepID=UPI003D735D8F
MTRIARAAAARAAPYTWAAAGLTMLSAAAWTAWSAPAGLAAAGISCLIMEWRVRGT